MGNKISETDLDERLIGATIIIGQELIECKKEVGHGNWGNWLKENFDLIQHSIWNYPDDGTFI